MEIVNETVFCPLMNRKIDVGYCWELCNLATDEILLDGDIVEDWDKAQGVCEKCGRYNDD